MSTDYPKSQHGEPTWEMAELFPDQGCWSEQEYLRLDAGRLVEFDNGTLEFVTMPTELHQAIAFFLCLRLRLFAEPRNLGVTYMAPLRVRVREGTYREPDVLFMLTQHRDRRTQRFWHGADLVMEIVSEDDPDRDIIHKRHDYAAAQIPEYWIVDPRDRSVTVLTLDATGDVYIDAGRYTHDQIASSILLDGFTVSVREVFDRPEVSD